ncbi:MAG: hypothetical protein IIT92_07425 [Bacteroidales bacterium]|jgi:hypothetical protein|nr:hypothetical protein [Bacteroidales bacterium]MBQ1679669.1 hypothetical protein [Bacteroidales bacterium]MBQ1754450.1 hypothetical protein [Bacteroidales bacterium]MBQ2148909.1 hypothetical protein [Bacteroidales bacterium]MBQ2194184.1 hypothetical protein [Bacteroidales bacterium]
MAASILDLIKNQVAAQAGNVEIPAQAKNTVLNGLTDSIFGSLTQTVAKPGGVDLIKNLLTGKTAAASSPITALAGNMFNANILKKLNLGSLLNGKLAALVPAVMGGLSGILKDQDGDGDVDFQDIIITLKGGNKTQAQKTGGGLLGGLLGKILGGSR